MPSKYYAVRAGRQTGIYRSWDAAKKQVSGFSGAQYKSFTTEAEAKAFMGGQVASQTKSTKASQPTQPTLGYTVVGDNGTINAHIARLKPDEAIAFTDGSYNKTTKQYAYGVVMITNDGEQVWTEHLAKALPADPNDDSHQVIGEVNAVKAAIVWAKDHEFKHLSIYADYLGVHEWALGHWQAKSKAAIAYRQFILAQSGAIDLDFYKVHSHDAAHPIDRNIEVDRLVKKTLGLR